MTVKPNLWLLLAVGVACLFPLLVFKGVELHGDDVLYAKLAADMAKGEPSFFTNTHTTRLGFLVPITVLYLGFGIHDWTTIAFPLASSLLAIGMVAFTTQRLYGHVPAMFAALICGLNPILYRSGTIGMPDIPAGFLYGVFVLGWILIVANKVQHRHFWASLSGLACAWALTTRISVAPMIIVTLGGFLLLSWRQGSLREIPLIAFFLGGCFIGIPYLSFLWWQTGNPFYFLEAAQGGYNLAGSPWIIPYEGSRFWLRVTGLSILRASIDGFLFAAFPIVVGMVLLWRTPAYQPTRLITIHFLLAVLAPLIVLSHFSTSFLHWYPVHLDLRFGSAIIMPLAILVAEACLRFPVIRLSPTARLTIILVMCVVAASGLLAWQQDNLWSIKGAVAALLVALGILGAQHGPKPLLPLILLMVLIGNWWHYLRHEYATTTTYSAELHSKAQALPQNSSLPILTDPLTAHSLSYLQGFTSLPPIATWEPIPTEWAEQRNSPWPGSFLLVWHPKQAEISAGRAKEIVPPWVLQEISQGRLIKPFNDQIQFSSPAFDGNVKPPTNYQAWPEAGIYEINGGEKDVLAQTSH